MAGWSNSSLTGRLGSLRPPQENLAALFLAASPSPSSSSPSSLCLLLSPPFVCLCEKPLVRSDGGARYRLKQLRFALSQRRRLPIGQSAAEMKALSVLKAQRIHFCFVLYYFQSYFYVPVTYEAFLTGSLCAFPFFFSAL